MRCGFCLGYGHAEARCPEWDRFEHWVQSGERDNFCRRGRQLGSPAAQTTWADSQSTRTTPPAPEHHGRIVISKPKPHVECETMAPPQRAHEPRKERRLINPKKEENSEMGPIWIKAKGRPRTGAPYNLRKREKEIQQADDDADESSPVESDNQEIRMLTNVPPSTETTSPVSADMQPPMPSDVSPSVSTEVLPPVTTNVPPPTPTDMPPPGRADLPPPVQPKVVPLYFCRKLPTSALLRIIAYYVDRSLSKMPMDGPSNVTVTPSDPLFTAPPADQDRVDTDQQKGAKLARDTDSSNAIHASTRRKDPEKSRVLHPGLINTSICAPRCVRPDPRVPLDSSSFL